MCHAHDIAIISNHRIEVHLIPAGSALRAKLRGEDISPPMIAMAAAWSR
jgi:hypothetical protein